MTKKKKTSEVLLGKKVTQTIVTMPTQNSNNIPKKNQVETCKTDVHRDCEKFSNAFPFQNVEQNYHFEPEKRCELEMKTRPEKARKYSYAKDCKVQPRETCKDVEEQHCHKGKNVVVEEVCGLRSSRIPIMGSLSKRKEEGEMGDNMRCLYTMPRSVHCGEQCRAALPDVCTTW